MSTDEKLTMLEGKLAGAERRARWALVLAVVGLGLFALSWLSPGWMHTAQAQQGPQDELRARRFVVVDANGKTRATLEVDSIGCAALALLDADGKVTFKTPQQREAGPKTKDADPPSKSKDADPAPKAKPQAEDPQKKEVTVYVTRTGKKYHSAGCRYLKGSGTPMTLSEAKAGGWTPCSVCSPPQ